MVAPLLPVPLLTLVNPAGVIPLQIVWSLPIDPAPGIFCTVIVTDGVADDSQANPSNVDIVILLNCVVCVNAPGLYVSKSPERIVQVEYGDTELSQR
jgi:hypothetical protein